jgi:hypothetical protein
VAGQGAGQLKAPAAGQGYGELRERLSWVQQCRVSHARLATGDAVSLTCAAGQSSPGYHVITS